MGAIIGFIIGTGLGAMMGVELACVIIADKKGDENNESV